MLSIDRILPSVSNKLSLNSAATVCSGANFLCNSSSFGGLIFLGFLVSIISPGTGVCAASGPAIVANADAPNPDKKLRRSRLRFDIIIISYTK